MLKIAVDLTSLLPGSENGGAKIMAIQLIKRLAALAPQHQFILLAGRKNAAELSQYKTQNIQTLKLSGFDFSFYIALNWLVYALSLPFIKLSRVLLPFWLAVRIERCSQIVRQFLLSRYIIKRVQPDLFFYPFTAVNFKGGKIPVVSVIYDLQFQQHPYFFTQAELYERRRSFASACKSANKVICISHFVKQTIMETGKAHDQQVLPIYIQLGSRLANIAKTKQDEILKKHQLIENQYLLFPANFWLHKNHQMLFTAFNHYRSKYPHSTLKLVCTGADNALKANLSQAVLKMGLSASIKLPGFLDDESFACLMSGCKAVIFPSLYEGFGMPVIEAMAYQKPVLCSNLTSLPEIVGEAAILFDPRRPTEIVDAIALLENDPGLVKKIIDLGHQHAMKFSNEIEMAKAYLAVFDEAVLPAGTVTP